MPMVLVCQKTNIVNKVIIIINNNKYISFPHLRYNIFGKYYERLKTINLEGRHGGLCYQLLVVKSQVVVGSTVGEFGLS